MTWRQAQTGFTLIETVLVVAVLAVILGIGAPRLVALVDQSRIRADEASVVLLNRATDLYRIQHVPDTQADPFEGLASDQARQERLVTSGVLAQVVEPRHPDGAFTWHADARRWLYGLYAVGGESADGYDFSALSPDGFQSTHSWEATGDGFRSGYGLLFIPNDRASYTLASEATLSGDADTRGGYGILFETVLDEDGADTGYVLQFDRGYNALVIRPRVNGHEGSPVAVIEHEDAPVIPPSRNDEWWTQTHRIDLTVEEAGEAEKSVRIDLDGVRVLEDFRIESAVDPLQNHTGFRSWHEPTTYHNLQIEP